MGRFGICAQALFDYLTSLCIVMLIHIDCCKLAISREVIAYLDSMFQALLRLLIPLELVLDMTDDVPDIGIVGTHVCYLLVVCERLFQLLAFKGNIAQNGFDNGLF